MPDRAARNRCRILLEAVVASGYALVTGVRTRPLPRDVTFCSPSVAMRLLQGASVVAATRLERLLVAFPLVGAAKCRGVP